MPLQKITKEEIIFKSMVVFREKGFHNTSMSDLATACGLTKGNFYNYFKNKNEMMEVILKEVGKNFNEKIFSIAYQDELTVQERGKMMAIKSLNLFSKGNGGCLMGNSILETIHTNPSFKTHLKFFFDKWIMAFDHLYNINHKESDTLQMAKESVSEIEGAIMLMQLYEDQSYLEKALKKMIKKLN